jgi:GNAT superfamily N-acetyltransferase
MSSGDFGGLHDRLLARLGDPVIPARPEHKAKIANLLDRVGIAHPVLDRFWPSYLVIPSDTDPRTGVDGVPAGSAPLVGCVAVEVAGDVALLRMLAVTPERRGEGLGFVLVETATERARAQGVRHLYLVTDGAQGYFGEKLGFAAIDRKDVAPEIAATAEYALARSKNATWMRKEL